MNDIFKSNIKARIEKAIEKEGVNQATAAQSIGIAACYVSHIKNPENWDKVPVAAWVIANKWTNSGQTLKEYAEKKGKIVPEPEGPEEHSPESVFGEREPEPVHIRPELMGMAKPKPELTGDAPENIISPCIQGSDFTINYYREEANKANQRISELLAENERLKEIISQQPAFQTTRDVKVNLIVKVKVEVEQ